MAFLTIMAFSTVQQCHWSVLSQGVNLKIFSGRPDHCRVHLRRAWMGSSTGSLNSRTNIQFFSNRTELPEDCPGGRGTASIRTQQTAQFGQRNPEPVLPVNLFCERHAFDLLLGALQIPDHLFLKFADHEPRKLVGDDIIAFHLAAHRVARMDVPQRLGIQDDPEYPGPGDQDGLCRCARDGDRGFGYTHH